MSLTDEQIEALNGISAKLRNSMNADTPKLPVLCYALDSSFLSEPDYKLLTAADFSIINTCNPSYFVAIVVVFIRNFYEKGCGDNYWKCTPSLLNSRVRFLDLLDQNPECQQLGFCNDFLPQKGTNIDNWVRSQCWILKVHDGNGRTSRMLKSNAAVKRIFDELFGDVSWEDVLTGQIDDEINSMELSPCYFQKNTIPEYVHYLFQNHRKTYLMSLLAMAKDADEPCSEHTPSWAKSVWGCAYTDMSQAQRNIPCITTNWKILINGNSRDLVLSYHTKKFKNAYLIQGDSRMNLHTSGQVRLSALLAGGFDVHQGFTITGETEKNGSRNLRVPALRRDATVFGAFDNGVHERRLLSSYGHISYAPANRTLYVVSPENKNNVNLTYDGKRVELQHDGRICSDYVCYSASLPIPDHPAMAPLLVNDTHILDLIERPALILLNAEKNMKLKMDNRTVDVIIGNRLRIYVEGNARIEPLQQSEQLLGNNEVEYEISCENMSKINSITVQRKNCDLPAIVRYFICLPEDWKDCCFRPDDAELYGAAKKNRTVYCYETRHHGVLNISVPIDKTYAFWLREDFSVSSKCVRSVDELNTYIRAEAYSNSRIKLEIKYDGRMVDGYPKETSRVYPDELIDVIEQLPPFARNLSFVVSFNNKPVVSTVI